MAWDERERTSVYYSLHNDSIFFCILNTFFVEALAFCYDFLRPDDIFTPFLVGTYVMRIVMQDESYV